MASAAARRRSGLSSRGLGPPPGVMRRAPRRLRLPAPLAPCRARVAGSAGLRSGSWVWRPGQLKTRAAGYHVS
ncbi:hypothetical protein AV530_001129 [Patagioenas fasciata monilis]|uniref:Uncharacterized protein n=1 Tax=Patagioenas fasciata monilis TaxID=372326 RepID=A0A1V4KTH1_PATFA|nr:hypothetical protein AV530_001129 [Patagioenas fasciata monilis]